MLDVRTEEFDDPEFQTAFWEWFDGLPAPQRKRFQEYPDDMAELNFYNKRWRHRERDDAGVAQR